MAPRRTCPVCGSKQWHKETHSGLVACSEGHILQDYRKETRDAYEVGAAGLRKRTLKSQRKRKAKDKSKADANTLHGLKGRYHHFQCLQLLLRKQISALMRLWSLPPTFETVCRDIWALHLSLLQDPVPSEPYFHAQEEKAGKLEEEEGGSSSSSSELDEDELQELLKENSGSSDEDDDGIMPKTKDTHKNRKSRRRRPGNELEETLMGNLSVLVVACWTLRIPMVYRDLRAVIESYDLPYLDAATQLPQIMRIHISKTRVRSLSPSHTPNTLLLHGLSARLARHLLSNFGVHTPEVNGAHVLWRTVKAMGGNVALYYLVKRISHALSLPLTLSPSLAPRLSTSAPTDPGTHIYDNVPPELAFTVVIVIALKMVYGLDGSTRIPMEDDDLACNMLRNQDYVNLVNYLNKEENQSKERLFCSETPVHAGELDEGSIDRYLDLCEKALLGNKEGVSSIRLDTLDQYFPVITGEDLIPSVLTSHDSLCNDEQRATEAAANTRLLPGQKYMVYFADDVGGEVEPEYDRILRRAVMWTGIDMDDIHPVIEAFERRLLRWWRREGRRAAGEMERDTSGEDSE